MSDAGKFSDRLCRAAELAGLTWGQLAKVSRLPMSDINALLNDECTEPASRMVNSLAAACDVSPKWLATGRPSRAARRAIEAALKIEADKRLGSEGWSKMQATLETLAGADELQRS